MFLFQDVPRVPDRIEAKGMPCLITDRAWKKKVPKNPKAHPEMLETTSRCRLDGNMKFKEFVARGIVAKTTGIIALTNFF